MMDEHPFSKKDISLAQALIKSNKVGSVLFSEGTYQVEVKEQKSASYWPFLQLDDEGRVLDCFCTCAQAEEEKSCSHLAAAYLKIFNHQSQPLHVRFRDSLWNALCVMGSRRHGYDAKTLKKKNQKFEGVSATHKRLFSIEAHSPKAKKRLSEILFHRVEETEETSLKFSKLPPEEIALWREGRPSSQLLYELSFWSDLAKWMMALQEEGQKYKITINEEEGKLPQWIKVAFADLEIEFYIAEANWQMLIPTLATVSSPLPLYEFQQHQIHKIVYEPKERKFHIESAPLKEKSSKNTESPTDKGIDVGEWLYVPHKGFFPAHTDAIFLEKEIPSGKISSLLQKHPHVLQKHLAGTKLHLNSVRAQYHLFFDKNDALHIACYVFEEGDVQKENSAYFGPWVYLQDKGFYLLDQLLFDADQKVIPKEQVSDFINRHRIWLNGFQGFQTHVHTIESQLQFKVSKEGTLRFDASLELTDTSEEIVDFGEWIFLKGKGFFAKRMGRGSIAIHPGMTITKLELPSFLKSHRDELTSLQGFFTEKSPLEECGLEIFLNETGRIVIRPVFHFYRSVDGSKVQLFGDYTYVEGEGFCEIPPEKRLPDHYLKERIIPLSEESSFIIYELETLKPFIFSIQKELKKPKDLFLRIASLQRSAKKKGAEWLLEGVYETDLGSVPLNEIWQAIQDNKRHLFTKAGLIVLKTPRFNWLKNITKGRFLTGGSRVRLTTLEWMRLTVFEDTRPPFPKTEEDQRTRQLIEELRTFHTDLPIQLDKLKSDLRSYQEMGVKWLWFLYTHGLSGLLCDEMGLGKTHQAMGLLAAAKSASEAPLKFLIVCPTSVIYHWEDLLKRFLPDIEVFIYYGIGRKLSDYNEKAEILLTSYGTLRSEKNALSQIPFDIAIYDEIQIAKNAYSQTHRALKKIKANVRIGLTGTPIENRLLELKALFDIVLPGYMPSEAHFKELFVNPIEKNQDAEKKALLSRFIKPFILRRKKSEVLLELPEKIEEISYCDLSEEQKELYKKTFRLHKEALITDLENETKPVPYLHVFSLLSSLKQICDHPCLISKKYDQFQKHASGKWDLFVELHQEVRDSGQKLVIFSQYLDMLDMMAAYFKEKKINFAGIRGSTRNRKEQLERFRDDPTCEVFLASLQAVGVGVDLVSASVVIHYDRWWNPARENQATDRVHRIGQSRGVQVFKLVTKGTIEEHIHRLIEKKLTLMEGVIGFDEQDQIKGLDRKELLQLLWLIEKDVEQT